MVGGGRWRCSRLSPVCPRAPITSKQCSNIVLIHVIYDGVAIASHAHLSPEYLAELRGPKATTRNAYGESERLGLVPTGIGY